MESAEIRRRWLSFFEERGHTVVPSASLIADDPTLLLVPAGMVPFKPYFLGEVKPPFERATSVQKCVRTPDIEEVGKTTRHGTFFQMCGNFSFGDYFKEGAIQLAWELLTSSAGRRRLRPGAGPDLWITVYEEDDEAERIWRDVVGVPAGAHPAPGQGGQLLVHGRARPLRTLLRDQLRPRPRRSATRAARPSTTSGTWRSGTWSSCSTSGAPAPGKADFPILGDLPSKNIDTGLGLERLAMILQDVHNMYEIDTSRLSSTGPPSSPACATATPRAPTSRCAWSPTTSAPPSCSSVTASPPATRAAATCCAASCAAPSATCVCWARRARPSPN